MIRLLALLFALLPLVASAALPYSARFFWDPPTTFADGSPLDPLTDLAEYRIYCDGSLLVAVPAPAAEYTTVPNELSQGSHTCEITSVDLALNESPASLPVTFTLSANAPVAIVNFGVD